MTMDMMLERMNKIMINDKNKGALLPFKRVVKVHDVSAIRMYSINITDDVIKAVPSAIRDGARGLGSTREEAIIRIKFISYM